MVSDNNWVNFDIPSTKNVNFSDNFIITGGNVGIGTTAPSAKLQVQDGAVLFSGTTGSTPVSGAGRRLMWIPAKSAFRAGYVSGSQWDDANIRLYSTAMGRDTTASGYSSTAMGYSTTASGYYSTAMGDGTTASAH
jgi:Hep_Hag.